MIRSFRDKTTEAISTGKAPKGFPADLIRVAQRKLFMLDNAAELADLKVPPGNRLEALKGDPDGQYSIRINDQFRVCFRWTDGGADNVEITDYH
ncbi:MAG: type II toxin-antitoxin system RelE/ParE family toxin [Mesorhizobium sp.]|uniref:type II toxin-antitoxin system RelE/ParE family toxin n=1 Tax=unclassified Mesorhizobium TaxID=325217 RepID=UPI000F75472F|nr:MULTISPECIES: type II toxin-antitoxin system RelE/ParE family toxin [unclassified Mesorhizobium]TGV92188.1 type II toxin-antitoxin system RelE/ParE family toxin [Mesorhizobium sp. M00.F.Ca.ET.158.01.1.1]AZO58386.1 type II toxin-antitoxin system RelE/ParE family toxin [Mesorhizobium sp. M1A.F.Ca.IN.022.06.1.1]MCT2579523.1 type II toxin-antitoxin system RelE/ParE family toxin [Mesorhizobium sp. P13.3]MDF3168302.1 type II toxin-antitoxin system RelE/ParE family toxin [Mesorhizobium sp. P16.1]M